MDSITLDEAAAVIVKIAYTGKEAIDVAKAKDELRVAIKTLLQREANPGKIDDKQPQRPATCRECVYCSGPEPAGGHAYCHFDKPGINPTGDITRHPKILPGQPACFLGFLSQTPWPTEPEKSHGEENIQE